MNALDRIRSALRNLRRQSTEASSQSTPDRRRAVGKALVTTLRQWGPSRTALVALGAALVFTVVVAFLYPPPSYTPTTSITPSEAELAAAPVSTVSAEPSESPTVTQPVVPAQGSTLEVPNPGPSASTPVETRTVQAYPGPGQSSTTPVPPPAPPTRAVAPTRTPTRPRASPSVPTATVSSETPAPTPVRTPTATFTPSATANSTIQPTPGPTTVSISVPTLATSTGYYYVIEAMAGEISATWKTEGSAAIQLLLYGGTPYGVVSGITDAPLGDALSVSNVAAGSASIAPVRVPPGNYTVLFLSGAMDTVKTRSASVTFVPARPIASTPTPTETRTTTPSPSRTRTPTSTATTPIPTDIPAGTETPTPTATEAPYPPPE